MQKAQCLEALGDIIGATNAFLLSLEAEKTPSGAKTTAPLEFAMFVVRHNLKEHYDDVVNILLQDDMKMLTLFPIGQYQAYATLAIIADETGHKKEARQFAQKALDAANVNDSGLRYHPKIGLVEMQDLEIKRKLEKIVGG